MHSHIHQEKEGAERRKRVEKEEEKREKETNEKSLMKDTKTECLSEVREGSQRTSLEVKKQGRNSHLNGRLSIGPLKWRLGIVHGFAMWRPW